MARFSLVRKLVLFTVALLFLGVGLSFGPDVFAQTVTNATDNINAVADAAGIATGTDLPTIIGRIIYILLSLVGIVLLGIILYAGFLWMTAAGDEKQVTQAKDRIRNAVIGLIIIASSFAITAFIMSQLTGEGGVFGPGDGSSGGSALLAGFPGSAGSLGSGRVRDVSPLPGSRGVPRNTAVMITFTEPIRLSSILQGYNDNGTPADLTDDTPTIGLNTDVVKIYPSSDPTRALTSDQVRVRFTPDRQTFVFKPVDPIGTPTQPIDYTVKFVGGTRGALLETCESRRECPVFEGAHSSGYLWQFQVSTSLDLTPPRVLSTMPASGHYAPNIVIQAVFDEPIDPTSISPSTFDILSVAAGTSVRPVGRYAITNGYTTVEFVTNVSCGVNSCGRQVFCLPANANIAVTIKAATLSTAPQAAVVRGLFDGVVDRAWNSLDGNGNGIAEGPGDDKVVNFQTDSSPNLSAPTIRTFEPSINASNIAVDAIPKATFDSILQASSVNTQSVKILTNETDPDAFWWVPRVEFLGAGDVVVREDAIPLAGRITIPHRIYMATSSRTFTPEYYPSVLSGVQNLYQNCFNPATYIDREDPSRRCTGTPNCCNADPSGTACPYPVSSRS